MRFRHWSVTVLLSLIGLLPANPLYACSICFGGNNAYWARVGYYSTTVALILLPLALAGGFIYWIRTRLNSQPVPEDTRKN